MTAKLASSSASAYAIVKAGGRQFRIVEGRMVRVPRIQASPGDEIKLEPILALIESEDKIKLGRPLIPGAMALCKVMRHGRFKKVVSYRYKRRKGYHRKKGHRQDFTEVLVTKIETGTLAETSTANGA